jgi:SAM-dependent methyltransferase
LLTQQGLDHTVAVDASFAMVKRAASACQAEVFCNASVLDLPFKSGSFDTALMIGVLCSIWPLSESRKAIYEVRRILRNGGLFLFQDFGLTLKLPYALRYLRYYKPWKGILSSFGSFHTTEGLFIHHFKLKELKNLFRDFEILALKRCVYPTMHGHMNRGFSILAQKPFEENTSDHYRGLFPTF